METVDLVWGAFCGLFTFVATMCALVLVIRQAFLAWVYVLSPYADSLLRATCKSTLEHLDMKKQERESEEGQERARRLWDEAWAKALSD